MTAKQNTKTSVTTNKRKLNVPSHLAHIAYHAQRAHRTTKISAAALVSTQLASFRENDNQHNQAMLAMSAAMRGVFDRAEEQEYTRDQVLGQVGHIGMQFAMEMVRWNKTREAISDDPSYEVASVPAQTFHDPNTGKINSDDADLPPLDNDLLALLGSIGSKGDEDTLEYAGENDDDSDDR